MYKNIIDIHTHVPPEEQWDLFLDEMEACGVATAITSSLGTNGWPAQPNAQEVRQANDQARRFCDFCGPRVKWLCYANPTLDSAKEEFDRCLSLGCCGLKLWVSLKSDAVPSLDKTLALLRYAGNRKMPVLIHSFQRTGRHSIGELSLMDIADLARKCPDTTIIAAHSGANWYLSQAVDIPDNLYLDICGTMPLDGMAESLVEWYGPSRILSGSDGLGRSLASQIAKVVNANLDNETKQALLHRNAERLFHLPAVPQEDECPYDYTPSAAECHSAILGPVTYDAQGPAWKACSSPDQLTPFLDTYRFSKLYASYGPAVYAQNLVACNREFMEAWGRADARLMPLATLLPTTYNWREALQDALRQGYKGAALFPCLHNWHLCDSNATAFFEACSSTRTPLWLNLGYFEERFMHPGLSYTNTTPEELAEFTRTCPQNRYVVIGASPAAIQAALDVPAPHVVFDVTRLLDGTGTLKRIMGKYGSNRLVMGTEGPLRHPNFTRFVLDNQIRSL